MVSALYDSYYQRPPLVALTCQTGIQNPATYIQLSPQSRSVMILLPA